MANTELADYKFTVKEGSPSATGKDDAPIWLMCEPRTTELSIVGNQGFLGVRLKPGVRMEQGKEIAHLLNENVVGITYTKF